MDIKTTVLTVNFNTSKFIKLSLYALKKLSYYPYEVIIIDNGSEQKDYKKLLKICSKYTNVKVIRKETDLRGSLAHGTALNELVKMVKTPFFSILDSDALWLAKHWDKILIEQFTDKIKVIGTQVPDNAYRKPKDFPLMFCILFETKTFLDLNIDFRPKDTQKGLDTGYEMREKYFAANLEGKNIEMKNTRTYKKGPYRDFISAEYYLDNDYKNIFAAHFGRGSQKRDDRYNTSRWIYNIPYISKWFINKSYIFESSKWIKLTYQIVNNHAQN